MNLFKLIYSNSRFCFILIKMLAILTFLIQVSYFPFIWKMTPYVTENKGEQGFMIMIAGCFAAGFFFLDFFSCFFFYCKNFDVYNCRRANFGTWMDQYGNYKRAGMIFLTIIYSIISSILFSYDEDKKLEFLSLMWIPILTLGLPELINICFNSIEEENFSPSPIFEFTLCETKYGRQHNFV
jgi:hypothetical protein